MSIAIPLTVGSEIQRASALQNQKGSEQSTSQFGEFSDDIIKLSELGLKKQLSEQVIENKNDISYESVRVSSTLGKSQSANNLTHTQATQLYNDIAAIM